MSHNGGAGVEPAAGRVAARIGELLDPGVLVAAPGEVEGQPGEYVRSPCLATPESATDGRVRFWFQPSESWTTGFGAAVRALPALTVSRLAARASARMTFFTSAFA